MSRRKSAKYPKAWKEFSWQIRHARAGLRCECVGECGLHQPWDRRWKLKSYPLGREGSLCRIRSRYKGGAVVEFMSGGDCVFANPRWITTVPDAPRRRCIEMQGVPPAFMKKGARVMLTVAHLCSCDPPCARKSHVKAMCQRCHLRLDVPLHQKHARETRELRSGQKRLGF